MTERPIIYDRIETRIFESGGDMMTEELARNLLGWMEPEEHQVFDQWHFKDLTGKTIYCSNVGLQRQYYQQTLMDIMWDILSGNWEFNLETVIIGETGLVLDGKHRLAALVLACQEFQRNPDRYPMWDELPEIEVLIALGAKEDKRVVNTIGTGRPRSLADSFYASGLFGENIDAKKLKQLCRSAEHTMRLLWVRTDARNEAYNPKFSHSDALYFLDRHPRVLQCVKTLHEENDGAKHRVDSFSGAYAPALLYLMSCSDTVPDRYRATEMPDESALDFSLEEEAESYWLALAKREPIVQPVIDRIAKMSEDGNIRADERIAIIIKGWNAYRDNGKVEFSDVEVKVDVDELGNRRLLEEPTLGGIDVGW